MAALVVGLVGVGMSAYGMYAGGEASAEQARRNQALLRKTASDNKTIAMENRFLAEKEALSIEGTGTQAVGMKRSEIKRLRAYNEAQDAISGFRHEGTLDWVDAALEAEGAKDVATIWANALTQSTAVRDRGDIGMLMADRSGEQMRIQGDIMVQAGQYAQQAGYWNAGSTLLGGVSNAYMTSQGRNNVRTGVIN